MPVNVSLELGSIVETESQIRWHTHTFSLLGGKVECEHIVWDKLLVHHLVENRSHTFLSELWISKTNDSLKVATSENSALLLNITEFLVLNVDLTSGLFTVTCTKSDIVSDKMSCKST
jgi:hypothetical protein